MQQFLLCERHCTIFVAVIYRFQNVCIGFCHNCIFNYNEYFKCIIYKKISHYKQEVSKTFIKPAISAVIMGAAIGIIQFGLMKFLPFGRLGFAICLIVAIPVGVIVYFAAVIGMKTFTEEELRSVPKGYLIIKFAKKFKLLS